MNDPCEHPYNLLWLPCMRLGSNTSVFDAHSDGSIWLPVVKQSIKAYSEYTVYCRLHTHPVLQRSNDVLTVLCSLVMTKRSTIIVVLGLQGMIHHPGGPFHNNLVRCHNTARWGHCTRWNARVVPLDFVLILVVCVEAHLLEAPVVYLPLDARAARPSRLFPHRGHKLIVVYSPSLLTYEKKKGTATPGS